MTARLYRIEVSFHVFYVSEDGSEPGDLEAYDAAKNEFRDNPENCEVFVSRVHHLDSVPADWRNSLARGTEDQRAIAERAEELFVPE